jgi:cell division protein FtsB
MSIGNAVVPGILLTAVYFALFGGEYSVFEVRAVHAAVEVEQLRLAEVSARIDSLAAWADSLANDDATIERVAREDFGLIRDGETLYRFADSDPGEDAAIAAEAVPAR